MIGDPRRPVTFGECLRETLRAHTALAMFLAGMGRRSEWQDLADACNIVEALHDMGKIDEVGVHWVRKSIDELVTLAHEPDGAMTPENPLPLKRVVTLYDYALARFSRATLDEARVRVITKVRMASLNPEAGLTVVRV